MSYVFNPRHSADRYHRLNGIPMPTAVARLVVTIVRHLDYGTHADASGI